MTTKLKDIMSRDVVVVHPDDSLQDAARKMRTRDVGFLPVCNGSRLVGALSDRDLAIHAVADGRDPAKTRIKDLGQSEVCWCFEDQSVDEAAKMMQDKEIRRIMVVSRGSKELVGVVSVGDLATRASSKTSGLVMEKTGPK